MTQPKIIPVSDTIHYIDATDCAACPLYLRDCYKIHGMGNIKARVLLIGDTPSDKPPGKILDELLAVANLKRWDVWLTNVCLCEPRMSGPDGKKRAPTAKEISACFPRLAKEIRVIRPEIIVLMGNIPLHLATNKRGITTHRGWQQAEWIDGDLVINRIYATLHPGSVLYGSDAQRMLKLEWMKEDWLIIERMLSAKETEREQSD